MSFDVFFQNAVALHQAGRLDDAENIYRSLLEISPQNADLLYLIGMIALQKNAPDSALEFLYKAVRLNPNAASYRFTLAQALCDAKKPKEALEQYKEVLKLNDSYPDTYNNMGLIYRASGDRETAETYFQKALKLNAAFTPALINLGLMRREDGKINEARELFEKALNAEEDNAEAAAQLAVCERMENRFEKALELYERALKHAPENADFWNGKGIVSECLKRYEDALASYDTALKISPRMADAHNNRANVLTKLGKHWDAEAAFKTAIKIDPKFVEAYNNLGALLFERERYEEALECYRKAFQINPKQAQTCNNLAMAVRAAGDLKEAVGLYFNALVLNPDDETVRHNLARALYDLYAHENCPEEAKALCEKWASAYPDDKIARHLADSLNGKQTDRADPEYVKELFDAFSPTFDQTLNALSYRVPDLIKNALKECRKGLRILDAGCGTGRLAAILKPYAGFLAGIDLSEKMVQTARNTGLYDELETGEIVEYLNNHRESFDLIVLADVTCYFGELSEAVGAVLGALKNGGTMLATFEKTNKAGYLLQPTGRFAHNRLEIEHKLGDAGFDLLELTQADLRTEDGNPVEGFLVKAAKNNAENK